eukprot:1278742-Amphidinium_carterae.1
MTSLSWAWMPEVRTGQNLWSYAIQVPWSRPWSRPFFLKKSSLGTLQHCFQGAIKCLKPNQQNTGTRKREVRSKCSQG